MDSHWTILALTEGLGVCPSCGGRSTHRHGWHERHLQDLPAQKASVTLKLRMRRWRCCNKTCERQTFVERLPEIATPLARRTRRAAELLHLFGHSVGGRPGERLMERIGMPTSDDTILRHLKRQAKARGADAGARVVGIDDWAWRKGATYGTIVVDLERREVIDVLPDRSTAGTANWLKQHPEVEIISRDRCGSFAQLRALAKARLRRGKSPIASISCRTYAKPSSCNSAAPLDHLCALCCLRRTAATSAM